REGAPLDQGAGRGGGLIDVNRAFGGTPGESSGTLAGLMGAMKQPETEPDAFDQVAADPAADPVQTISFDEAKEAVAAKGRERGFVTSDELLEGLPVEDLTPEQVEDFLAQVEEHLRIEGIEIVEAAADKLEVESPEVTFRLPREDELLNAPTNDPVRMY